MAKQNKNEARAWPDWRTADPNKAIEHNRSGDKAPTDRIYLSGPMTGLPGYNFAAFNAAAARLRAAGLDVVNPAEINTDSTLLIRPCEVITFSIFCLSRQDEKTSNFMGPKQ